MSLRPTGSTTMRPDMPRWISTDQPLSSRIRMYFARRRKLVTRAPVRSRHQARGQGPAHIRPAGDRAQQNPSLEPQPAGLASRSRLRGVPASAGFQAIHRDHERQSRNDRRFRLPTVDPAEKAGMVRAVFDSVAPRYDLMNDLMSLGIHRVWKQIFISDLQPRPQHTLLDLAGGTGDISFGWLKRGGGPVFLTDINRSMLSVGRDRALNSGFASEVSLVVADAEKLPLPDRCVDRVSIAFGLRNCTDKPAVLREARRVLKPGGRFLCLEFSRVTVYALTPVLRRLVVQGAAAAGPDGRRGRGQLPLSGREHPHVSRPGDARRDDA